MKRDAIDGLVEQWAHEWPELDASHLETIGRIWRINEHLRRRFDAGLQPFGLNWEAFDVIASLRRSGAPYRMRPSDLNKACLLTSGAMTNRLDRAEKGGLVARQSAADDRRSIQVELTPDGVALANQAIEQHFASARQLLGCLTAEEQSILAGLLHKILAAVEPSETGAGSIDRAVETAPDPALEAQATRKAIRKELHRSSRGQTKST